MKGLIIKDIMCLKKQLTTFAYIIAGVVVISILYVLSSRFGNLAKAGVALLDENNNMSQVDVKNLGSMVLVMFMLIPIVSVGDMLNVFIADGKAGFFKVSASLPISMSKRMFSRFLTIYALCGIGAVVDIILALVLSALTDIMGFGSFLGIIISCASILSIYSALVIFYCVILGYGKEQYAQVFSLLSIILAFVIGCILGSIIHLIRMKVSGQDHVLAFGPYLAAGIFIASLWGDKIVNAYLSTF